MVTAAFMLFPNSGSGIRVEGKLELDDVLPISIGAMPVFIRGTITKIDDGERLLLQMSKKITAIFNTTQLQYEVLIDFKTWEFKAVNTSERGI